MAAKGEASHTIVEDYHYGILIEQLSECASKWESIAAGLRFKGTEISVIKRDTLNIAGGSMACLGDVLIKWIQWAPGDARGSKGRATLEALKKAVSKAGFGVIAQSLTLSEDSEHSTSSGSSQIISDFKLATELSVATISSDVIPAGSASSCDSTGGSWNPQPVDLGPYFPLLTDKERQNSRYLQKLKNDTEEIKLQFELLVFKLREDIEKSQSLKNVISLLRLSKTFLDFKKLLTNDSTLDEVFDAIADRCSFFSFGLVKHVAYQFASQSFAKKLKKYKKQFQEYSQRRVCEVPSDTFGVENESEKVYKIKIEDDLSAMKVEEISKLEFELNKILGHELLQLLKIEDGCVELTYKVSEIIDFTFTEKQRHQLRRLRVLSITSGDQCIVISSPHSAKDNIADSIENQDQGIQVVPMHMQIQSFIAEPDRDSGIATGETSSKLTESAISKEETFHICYKMRDLHDSRIEMMILAESKPKLQPFSSPLSLEIRRGNLEQVKKLIKQGHNPMEIDLNGESCLHYAVRLHQFEILKYLIEEEGLPGGTKGFCEMNILQLAALTNQFDMVKYLIEHEKLDPAEQDEDNSSTLYYACRGGSLNIVQYLMEYLRGVYPDIMALDDPTSSSNQKPQQVLLHDDLTRNPLSCACYFGHLPIVKFLIEECHCDPFQLSGKKKLSPFYSAVLSNHIEIAEYLGSLKSFTNPHREPSLLHLAAMTPPEDTVDVKMIKYLTQNLHFDFNSKHNGNTVLHYAALEGKFEIAKFLVDTLKCDPKVKGERGCLPIHYAAQNGHFKIVQFLMESHTGDVSGLVSDQGETPLHSAAACGHLPIVKYLVKEHNFSPLSVFNDLLGSSFHCAARKGDIDITQYFVKELKCDPNTKTKLGITPLHLGAEYASLEYVKFLIEKLGCNKEAVDGNQDNALHHAIMGGQLSVCKYLIENQKFTINSFNCEKMNLTQIAAFNGKLEILKYLIENQNMSVNPPCSGPGYSLLCEACIGGNLELVKYLLGKGSKRTKSKLSPLHYAALNGHLDIVKYFMNSKYANAMYFSVSYNVPLYAATERGHFEVVKYLIEEKACDPYIIDMRGDNLLHLAAAFGHLEIAEYLVQNTTLNPLTTDDLHDTALSLAAMKGHLSTLKFLLGHLEPKYDPSTLCNDDKLIHVAIEGGHFSVVKYLVEEVMGDPFLRNDNGHMPIHRAAVHDRLDILKYLVEEVKCDPMVTGRDNLSYTPLHFAALNDNLDVMKYLIEEQNCDAASKRIVDITPLHDAAMKGNLDIVRYLVSDRKVDPFCNSVLLKGAPIHLAAVNDNIDVVKFLVKECNQLFFVNANNQTPLKVALQCGSFKTAQFLQTCV